MSESTPQGTPEVPEAEDGGRTEESGPTIHDRRRIDPLKPKQPSL